MHTSAFWRTLYTSGHDAAFLSKCDDGWALAGHAVYLKDGASTALGYRLNLGPNWATRSGAISGHVGGKPVRHDIRKVPDGWLLNGRRQDRLNQVQDLDFGFTPATNFAQLRRMNLANGESSEIVVAWMDVDSTSLEPLPQIYRRVSERSYDYESPQNAYHETLELQPNGFVRLYPGLWEAEPS